MKIKIKDNNIEIDFKEKYLAEVIDSMGVIVEPANITTIAKTIKEFKKS